MKSATGDHMNGAHDEIGHGRPKGKKHWKNTCFSSVETKVAKKHWFYGCFVHVQNVDTKNDSRIGFIGVLRKCKKALVLLLISSHESV